MFINPGGPGGPGVQFVREVGHDIFSDEVRARFDVVGFDPRGVISSSPLQCFDTPRRGLRGVQHSVRLPRHEAGGADLGREQIAGSPGPAPSGGADPGPHVDGRRGTGHGPAAAGSARQAADVRRLLVRHATSVRRTRTCSPARSAPWSWTGSSTRWHGRRVAHERSTDNAVQHSPPQRCRSDGHAAPVLLKLCDRAGDNCAFSQGDPEKRYQRLAEASAPRTRRDPRRGGRRPSPICTRT